MTDSLVVWQDIPLGKKDGPVTFVTIDEWKDEGAGIGHIGADIEEIFEEPKEGEGQAVSLAVIEKESGTESGHDQFAEGSAQDHERVAEVTEERMAGFVNDKIGEIEKEEAGSVAPGVEKEEDIAGEDYGATDAGDAGPVLGPVEG